MKNKKIPMRSCVVTHEKLPKKELVRVVRTPEGSVVADKTGKVNGRGAYLKLALDIIDKAEKSKILDKVLEVEVPSSVYEELRSWV